MTDRLPLSREEFDDIYSKVSRTTVELVIETDEGYVLTERSIEPCIGQWHIPGGTVRHGETLHQAIKRIAQAELGVELNVRGVIGYIEYPQMHADGYSGWPIGIAFLCTVSRGTLQGSEQGEVVKCFKQIPKNTIQEQKVFLENLINNTSTQMLRNPS
jgi:ADP-ribose pyrophosphatase YjhB (NUDIX family)